ncbi:MAG TPA: hypothetical protein VIV56_00425, partial [Gemmatimonadales bacterium]
MDPQGIADARGLTQDISTCPNPLGGGSGLGDGESRGIAWLRFRHAGPVHHADAGPLRHRVLQQLI